MSTIHKGKPAESVHMRVWVIPIYVVLNLPVVCITPAPPILYEMACPILDHRSPQCLDHITRRLLQCTMWYI
jgi:hypothetical protein